MTWARLLVIVFVLLGPTLPAAAQQLQHKEHQNGGVGQSERVSPAQDPRDARIKTLEAQLLSEQQVSAKARLELEQVKGAAKAAPQLTPAEQRARVVEVFEGLYEDVASSPAAEACDRKGKSFFALVIDGKVAPLCELEYRRPKPSAR